MSAIVLWVEKCPPRRPYEAAEVALFFNVPGHGSCIVNAGDVGTSKAREVVAAFKAARCFGKEVWELMGLNGKRVMKRRVGE